MQHHEIEMFYTLVIIITHALLKCLFSNNFTDVLVYKGIFVQCFSRSYPKPFLFGLNNIDRGILGFLEAGKIRGFQRVLGKTVTLRRAYR